MATVDNQMIAIAGEEKVRVGTTLAGPGILTAALAVQPADGFTLPRARESQQQFTATVTGTTNTGVKWSVLEAGGGQIDANGLYTAPATPGTYHVRVASLADPNKSDDATVTVLSPVFVGPIDPPVVFDSVFTQPVAVGTTVRPGLFMERGKQTGGSTKKPKSKK